MLQGRSDTAESQSEMPEYQLWNSRVALMKSKKIFGMQIPENVENISVVCSAARECARARGFSQEDVQTFCLVVEEALTNSIEMGFGDTENEVDITIYNITSGLGVKIDSVCLPLEPEKLPQYNFQRVSQYNDTTGLSYHLMKNMSDSFRVSISEDGARELYFEKYIPEQKVKDAVQRKKTLRVATEHIKRFAVPEDAEKISRLVLRSHDAVLFGESIYYPDMVKEMLAEKRMVSVVAEAECGELIAHFALLKDISGDRVEELTYVVSDKNFKSRDTTKLPAILIEDAKRRGVYAIQSYVVTNHIYAQKGCLADGFSENALYLALNTASRHKQNEESSLHRIGTLGLVRYLGARESAPLFLPPRHREMILDIYAHMGVEPVVAEKTAESDSMRGCSQIVTDVEFKEGWMLIVVKECGPDTFSHLKSEFYKAVVQGIPSIQLGLPLANAMTLEMCSEFESMGFFFAGVSSGYNSSENLMLQYLNGVDPGFDSIHTFSDFAKKLKSYVHQCWEERAV